MANIAYRGDMRLAILMWTCELVHYVGGFQCCGLVQIVSHDEVRCVFAFIVDSEGDLVIVCWYDRRLGVMF